jgi:integrase/recombinase XerC
MFIALFVKHLQFEKKFSKHTIIAYNKDLSQFSEYLQQINLDISGAGHVHVRSWMVDLLEKGAEAKTIHRKISCLRSFYKFLVREQLVDENPLLQLKVPKMPKRLPVFVEEQRMDQLLDDQNVFGDDFSGLRDRLVIELLYGTGIRLAELINLREEDLDSYEKSIKVLGKRNKERIIPIHTSLMCVIKEYMIKKQEQAFDDNKSSTLIVTNVGQKVYSKFIYRVVKKYLSLVSTNEKRGPHTLRHTFATALLNRGADMNAIKELLGHASLAATQVYTHNTVERLKSIYKQAHPKA